MSPEWMHEPDQEGPVIGALDAQLDLRRWWRTPHGQQFGKFFGESVASQMILGALDPDQEGVTPDTIERLVNQPETKITIAHAMQAREIASHEIDTLGRAATFYVTPEMVNEIGEAAATIPDGLVVEAQMLPTSHGFVVLAEPLVTTDLHEKEFYVPAFTWGSDEGTPGVDFCSYSDTTDERDPDYARLHQDYAADRQTHPLMLLHIDGIGFGTTIGAHFTPRDPDAYEKKRLYERVEFGPDGEPARTIDAVGLAPAAVQSARDTFKWLVAFWTITQQRLPVIHRPGRSRQQMRQLQRTLPDHPDECSIRVVDLRAYQQPRDGEDVVPREMFWSHRWRVRGFWRTYHRGTPREFKGWVESYVKGPKDAPLIERDHVFRVRR